MQERVANLANGPIHYLDAGEGPELILLHGGGLDSARLSWGHLIPELSEHYRVLAPNWPGYGGSAWSERWYTTQDLIGCLESLLDYWSVPTACLAGISMGGGVAVGLALSKPNRVNQIVLVGSYGLQQYVPMHKLGYFTIHLPGMISISWKLLRWSRLLTRLALKAIMKNSSNISEDLVDECYAAVQEPSAGKAFLSWQRSEVLWNGLRTYYADQLSGLHCPVLLLHGANDPLVPLAAIRRAANRIPRGTLSVFEETGHWPQREKPDAFIREIVGFIRANGQSDSKGNLSPTT